MFDIGWSELLVIAIVAIIVVGPKDLPRLMRSFGQYAGRLRRAAAEFQRQFEESMQEAELEEVRQAMADMRDTAASLDLGASIDQPVMRPKQAADAAPKPVPKSKRAKAASPAKSRSAKPRAAKAKSAARRASKMQASKD